MISKLHPMAFTPPTLHLRLKRDKSKLGHPFHCTHYTLSVFGSGQASTGDASEHKMFNRSGGDEGYPMENINRNKQIVRYSGPMKGPSETIPQGQDSADVEFQIHCIETEAYTNVLRAFIAQSDVLSWGKEGLISELRKELRVSDVEHRKLLAKVNSDDSVRMIREWRKGPVGEKKLLSNSMKPTASLPCSTSLPSSKRLKNFQPPASIPSNYLPMSHHSSAPSPYSMAIHCKDDQWGGEMALFSRNATIQQSIRSGPLAHDSRQASTVGIGSRQVMVRSNKGQHPLDVNNSEKRSDVIRIRATDDLIHEVERVFFGQRSANPVEVAKAKMLLKEHEQAILEALDKLAPLADNDNSPGHSHQRYSYEGQQRNGHQLGSHDAFYGHPVHVPFTKAVGDVLKKASQTID